MIPSLRLSFVNGGVWYPAGGAYVVRVLSTEWAHGRISAQQMWVCFSLQISPLAFSPCHPCPVFRIPSMSEMHSSKRTGEQWRRNSLWLSVSEVSAGEGMAETCDYIHLQAGLDLCTCVNVFCVSRCVLAMPCGLGLEEPVLCGESQHDQRLIRGHGRSLNRSAFSNLPSSLQKKPMWSSKTPQILLKSLHSHPDACQKSPFISGSPSFSLSPELWKFLPDLLILI